MPNLDKRGQWTQKEIDAEVKQFERLNADLRFRRICKLAVGIGLIIAGTLALAFCIK